MKRILLLAALITAHPFYSHADECVSKTFGENHVPFLSGLCPIGDEINDNTPTSPDSLFFIQCGDLSPLPIEKSQASELLKLYPVWNKTSKKGILCLMGTYTRKDLALAHLDKVRKIKGYEKSRLRELKKFNPLFEPIDKESHGVEITEYTIGKLSVSVPLYSHENLEIYCDKNHASHWNRVNHVEALNFCRAIGKRLPSNSEWTTIQKSAQIDFPKHLPFWSNKAEGLLSSSSFDVTKKSLLGVICVSEN
ncbi:hypothetical protein [Vibrio campbellii]|uniref:hypothetical protein n=1 Tax=Vibrio campbellii TaxID=680 RepID=UPI000CD3508C|nr:hypothetical protein [Vibrio campbellii]AUW07421.1 hypothetical protein C1N51_27590 [Vibrio campbellii]